MLKKSAFVSVAAAGLMMLGSPAFASDGGHHDEPYIETEDNFAVLDVGDVLSNNAINACHNNVNVLGVQVADVANGLALNLPILNEEPVSSAEGGANCVAGVVESNYDD